MSCLVYCILPRFEAGFGSPPPGVDGQPVSLVTHRNLGAVVSRLPGEDTAPEISRLRAFAKVVAHFHWFVTVIPMRYGCAVDDESRVVRLLEERRDEYRSILESLDGCVEMGLRVLIPRPPQAEAARSSPAALDPAEHPGRAYLLARSGRYAQERQWAEEYRLAAGRCRDALAGQFVKVKDEVQLQRSSVLSMYFLVRREFVESFRRAFRTLKATESAKLMLTGPWPPYNFVHQNREAGICVK